MQFITLRKVQAVRIGSANKKGGSSRWEFGLCFKGAGGVVADEETMKDSCNTNMLLLSTYHFDLQSTRL